MTWSGGWTSIGDRSLQCHECQVLFSMDFLCPRMALVACRVIGQSSAVLGCIRDVSLVLDEVDVIVDEGSTVSNVTQGSEPRYLCFDA